MAYNVQLAASLIGTAIQAVTSDSVKEAGLDVGQASPKELIRTAINAKEQATQLTGKDGISDLNIMKKEYGPGVCTLITIANCTGADMRIVSTTDYHGHLWKYPPPPNIGPGQVGVFMHVKTRAAMSGSKGYVTYKAKNPHGVDSDVHLGFDAGFMNQQRRVHTVIGDDDKSLKDSYQDIVIQERSLHL